MDDQGLYTDIASELKGAGPADTAEPQSTYTPPAAPSDQPSDPYADIAKQLAEQNKQTQKQAIVQNSQSDLDPVRQAQAVAISKRVGIPAEVAYAHANDYRERPIPDAGNIVENAPTTAKFLADPTTGPAMLQDHESLTAIEQAFGGLGLIPPTLIPRFREAIADNLWDKTIGHPSWGQLTPEQSAAETQPRVDAASKQPSVDAQGITQADIDQATKDQLDPNGAYSGKNYNPNSDLTRSTARDNIAADVAALANAKDHPVTQTALRNVFDATMRDLGDVGAQVLKWAGTGADVTPDSVGKGLSGGFPLLSLALRAASGEKDNKGEGALSRTADAVQQSLEQRYPGDQGRSGDMLPQIVHASVGILPFLLAGAGAAGVGVPAAAAAGLLGAMTMGGSAAFDADAHNATPAQRAWSWLFGTAAGATMALPVHNLLHGPEEVFSGAAARLGMSAASNAVVGGGTMAAQQGLTDIYPSLTYDKGRSVLGNMFSAGGIGALVSAVLGSVGETSQRLAESNRDKLLALADYHKRMQLAQTAAPIVRDFFDQVGKDVEISAPAHAIEKLFQEVDPEVQKKVYGDFLQKVQEAKATGAEVTIPSGMLPDIMGLKGYEEFVDNARVRRLTPDVGEGPIGETAPAATVPEAIELRKHLDEVADHVSKTADQHYEDSPIFTSVRDQLLKAGYGPEVAAPYAMVAHHHITTTAREAGLDPVDLFNEMGLRITNSEMEPKPGETRLAQGSQTETPEFKNWFGDSKVVDEQGKPLVVYHGGAEGIQKFESSSWRYREYMTPAAREGVVNANFFTKDHGVATTYKGKVDNHATQATDPRGAVHEVYLNIRDPLVVDWGGKKFTTGDPSALIKQARDGGHDGIIVNNVVDDYHQKGKPTTVYVPFSSEQIKSATGNSGAFDPSSPNILYQSAAPTVDGQSQQPGNKHGLAPHLRVETGVEIPKGKKPLFAQTTMNSTAPRQIAAIDEVLGRHPNATASIENWNAMMADALASADVPVPPYAFIENLNGDGSQKLLEKLSPGQIADADHGFANAAAFRDAYTNGRINIRSTGKLFLWSFLSRGVSPYTQESLFLDSFKGIDQWIDAAADGTLKDRLDEYEAWAKTAAPQGSGQPGAGATHNLNAFGKLFLMKMSEDAGDGTGRSRLQVLHDMMTDPNSTGKAIRRKFLEMGEGVGIDNKVVSFTLLVAGFKDVMVLDRVQIRELWNDGRFDGINLYDGYKDEGKPVAGSALSSLTYGARGLLVYEAIEQGLKAKVDALYGALGRPQDASPGRYHWETWVASSNQEASHATIDAILADAHGASAPLEGVTAKEGEYGAFAYGARYGRDGMGQPYFLYSVPGVGDFKFSVPAFRDFLDQIKVKANGIIPGKFKVTESGNGPWYNRPEVNIPKLGELAGRIGERYEPGRLSDADAAHGIDPSVSNRLAADQPGSGPPTAEGQAAGAEAKDQAVNEGPQAGPSSSQTTLNQNARGFITFGPARDAFHITLTGKANLSTFLHEYSHFALEVLQKLVDTGRASDRQVEDLRKLRDWMGLKDGEKVGVREHEMFARGMEAHFMEGKAPSPELAGVYQRFKSWMIAVYKTLSNLNVNLTDEVRGVMDRMVASDEAIKQARAEVGWQGKPMTQEETGFTDAEYKTYVDAWTKASDAQAQEADARVMLEAARAVKEDWRKEKISRTETAENELAQTRGWKAWKLLTKGEGIDEMAPGRTSLKIDPETVPAEWRGDVTGMTADHSNGGMPLDVVGESLGFKSGEEMISTIAAARAAEKAIPAKVRADMEAAHGKMDDAALAFEAAKAMHNKPTLDVLLTEFRAMARKAGSSVPSDINRILAEQAAGKVSGLTKRELGPSKWKRAELRAAREVGALSAKGDKMGALVAKRQQLIAAHMGKATLDAIDRIDKIRDYLATFKTNRRRAALGKAGDDYLDGVDQILEGINFKDVSLKAIKARQSLDDLVRDADKNGEPVFISDETRALLGRKNYTELTLAELEGVHDAVKNLWTIAKNVTSVRKGEQRIALATAIETIKGETILDKKTPGQHLNKTKLDKAGALVSAYHAGLLKAEFILDWFGKTAHDLIYQPISDAARQSWELHRDLTAPFMDKLRTMPKEQKARWNTARTFLDYPADVKLKGANIWTIALNMGNDSNKAKLFSGYGWTEEQVMSELGKFMTKDDWDLAQEAWDTIDKMWPQMAAVVKRATGLEPPKIEPTPVHTPFGTYRGGYFPVVYDRAIDARMDDKLDSSIKPEEMFAKKFTAFVIDNGFTKARTANTGKLLFDPNIIANHLGEVIHYATHYDAVKQADRLLRDPTLKAFVQERAGKEVYSELKQWLKDVATNRTESGGKRPDVGDMAFRKMRMSAQIAALGLNLHSAISQVLGIATTLDALKLEHFSRGIQEAWLSPYAAQNWRDAYAKSKELAMLDKNYDRDLAAMSKAWADSISGHLKDRAYELAFKPISVMQSIANVAAWRGGYSQALAEGMSEADAINFADKVVRQSQGSGAMKDLSGIQRGGETAKFFTSFFTYYSMLYNRMADIQVREKGLGNLHRKVGRYAVLLLMSEALQLGFNRYVWNQMFPPNKQDDTPFATRLALNMVDSAINTLPVVRDIYGGAKFVAGIDQMKPPPGIAVIGNTYKGGKALWDWAFNDKDMTRSKARSVASAASAVTGTPIYGVWRLIDDVFGAKMFDK